MQYRTLGKTGIKVSPYALGSLMFATRVGNPDPADSIRVIHKALDTGINLIDTADAYEDSEEIVGAALKGRRNDVVLAMKFSRPMGEDPNRRGASRRWIVTAVEDSLRRLQTDYVDLYQVHRFDPDTDIEETLSALTDLIRSGKVRAIGSSNTPASDIVEAQWVAERRGLARFSHRATALLDPESRHRNRSPASASALWHGRGGVGTAWAGHAHRQGPARAGDRRSPGEVRQGVHGRPPARRGRTAHPAG